MQQFVMRLNTMDFKVRDIGVLPLMLSFPFMFYPKLLNGDTQPWVLIAALIAFFTFRTDRFFNKRDSALIILPFLCIFAYLFRNTDGFELLRHTYTYLAFLIFWVVCRREKGDYFSIAIKATVVIWFVVGFYQYLAIKLGYQIDVSGRYLAGRMGPPSLTAEASYYGSISMIHLMCLLSEKNKNNGIFIACAVASIVLSGSLLAMVLFVFPLMKLPTKYRLGVIVVLPIFVIGDYYFTSSGVTSRLVTIFSEGISIGGASLDASFNLRAGHIYFTLYENFIPSLLLLSPIDFMNEYNYFATRSDLLIETGSNYILPAIGEMIYGSGIFALILLIVFLKRSQEFCMTKKEKVEKVGFIIACMLNPISISNIFLIIYATRRG